MINGTSIALTLVAVVLTVIVGAGMYLQMLDQFYEQPSIHHKRFWLCQFIVATVAICLYLTRVGVIIWN
jgi:hypothetical protein